MLEVKWIGYKEAKELRHSLEFLASDDLMNELDEWIKNNDEEHGAYLINIFSHAGLRELSELGRNYYIDPLFPREDD